MSCGQVVLQNPAAVYGTRPSRLANDTPNRKLRVFKQRSLNTPDSWLCDFQSAPPAPTSLRRKLLSNSSERRTAARRDHLDSLQVLFFRNNQLCAVTSPSCSVFINSHRRMAKELNALIGAAQYPVPANQWNPFKARPCQATSGCHVVTWTFLTLELKLRSPNRVKYNSAEFLFEVFKWNWAETFRLNGFVIIFNKWKNEADVTPGPSGSDEPGGHT